MGEFFGINAVILVFTAVDQAQVKGMGKDEGEVGLLAGVGQPVPAEHAFAADGDIVPVGGDEFEEEREVVGLDVGVDELPSLLVHDADVHLPRMEIDSAVEFCGGCIILHVCCMRLAPGGAGFSLVKRGVLLTLPALQKMLPNDAINKKGLNGSINTLHTNGSPGGLLKSAVIVSPAQSRMLLAQPPRLRLAPMCCHPPLPESRGCAGRSQKTNTAKT